MIQHFADKSANVVLVESTSSMRQSMAEVLKNAGFKNIQAVASIQDAYAQLETEVVHWMILPLGSDQPINAMHMLGLCVEVPELRHIRISLILDESERDVLSKAFDLGAMSWHPKTATKNEFQSEIEKLVQKLNTFNNTPTLVAADYLREHLVASKDPVARLLLETSLNTLFPGNPRLMLQLAKAQNSSGMTAQARATVGQVKIVGPELTAEADNVLSSFAPSEGDKAAGTANVLGVNSCVIIDSDDAVRSSIEALLKELGVTQVNAFGDGEAAWKHLDANPEPSLVLMEWRVPQISGPQLIQRIRHKGFHATTIILHSSLVKASDLNLLKEISVANLATKPYEKTSFLKAIIGTVQQERSPTEHQALERKFRTLLAANKVKEAKEAIGRFLTDTAVSDGRKALVEAELAFAMGDFHLARGRSIDSLKALGENILTLNVMAKTFMRLGDHGNALKCFEKAQSLSPQNIERLCLIAETQTDLGEKGESDAALAAAAKIDQGSSQVKEATARISVMSGPAELAQKLMSTLESAANVVSYLNNKAVASTRMGKFDLGFELYDKTLQSLGPDHELKGVVLYNLALAKIRSGDNTGAMKALEQAIATNSPRTKQKASSLHTRLKQAMDKGTNVKLHEDDKTAQALQSAMGSNDKESAKSVAPLVDDSKATLADFHAAIMDGLNPVRGEICCYMLYNFKGKLEEKLQNLFKNPPKYARRAAIEREESGGVDRAARAS